MIDGELFEKIRGILGEELLSAYGAHGDAAHFTGIVANETAGLSLLLSRSHAEEYVSRLQDLETFYGEKVIPLIDALAEAGELMPSHLERIYLAGSYVLAGEMFMVQNWSNYCGERECSQDYISEYKASRLEEKEIMEPYGRFVDGIADAVSRSHLPRHAVRGIVDSLKGRLSTDFIDAAYRWFDVMRGSYLRARHLRSELKEEIYKLGRLRLIGKPPEEAEQTYAEMERCCKNYLSRIPAPETLPWAVLRDAESVFAGMFRAYEKVFGISFDAMGNIRVAVPEYNNEKGDFSPIRQAVLDYVAMRREEDMAAGARPSGGGFVRADAGDAPQRHASSLTLKQAQYSGFLRLHPVDTAKVADTDGRFFIRLSRAASEADILAVAQALRKAMIDGPAAGLFSFDISAAPSDAVHSLLFGREVKISFHHDHQEPLLVVMANVVRSLSEKIDFDERGPMFALRLCPGLFFGEEPRRSNRSQDSYHADRENLLATIYDEIRRLEASGLAVDADLMVAIAAHFFRNHSIDAEHPAFSRDGFEMFHHIARHGKGYVEGYEF